MDWRGVEMNYFPDRDEMWNRENVYSIGYCHGLGLDIGCGRRTLFPHTITYDKYADRVDYQGDANKLPFKDNTFSFVYASHVLEHCEDVFEAIREWYRVIKRSGYLVIISPDCRYVPMQADPQHKQMFTVDDVREIVRILGYEQVNKNLVAYPNYSFLIVVRKQ